MLDCFLGSIIFICVLPMLAIIVILIKLDSPGDVFYLSKRLGKDGKEFVCYKFRTMYDNAEDILQDYLKNNADAEEEWRVFAKIRNEDPRVTPMGKWMRKYSLDELPQIFNVLKGDMSLVGPRPYLPSEEQRMEYYKNTILMTLPGITGLWQVSGRNDISFDGRLNLDCWYVRNWSMWMDLVILLKTIKVVLAKKGAY
jgi:undecaprenyl-phosphate galactose phosphotransferase